MVKKNPTLFTSLLGGAISENYDNIDSLITTINDVFVLDKPYVTKFNQWNELFIELSFYLYDLVVHTLIDKSGSGTLVELVTRHSHAIQKGYDLSVFYKMGEFWYPLVLVDQTKTESKIIEYRWLADTVIADLFNSMIKFYEKEFETHTRELPDLNIIYRMIEDRQWSLKLKLANKQNLCYAVIISNNVNEFIYCAIDYSVMSSDNIPVSYEHFNINEYKISLKTVLAFVDIYNSYVNPRYRKLKINKYMRDRHGMIYGMIINNACFYFNPTNDVITEYPIYDTITNWHDVNITIMRNTKPVIDNRTKLLSISLYSNYLYQLFMLEFINYVESERNIVMRKKVKELIPITVYELEKFDKLMNLLDQHPNDKEKITTKLDTLFSTYAEIPAEAIDEIMNDVFEFDQKTLNYLMSVKDKQKLKEILTEVSSNFSVEGTIDYSALEFSNIFLTCANDGTSAYCHGKKIIIDKNGPTSLDNLIDILADDLTNDFKMRYLFQDIRNSNIIDYFGFIDHPLEIIEITKQK